MFDNRVAKCAVVLVLSVLLSAGFAVDPPYQAVSPSGVNLASGVSDLSGPGGKAYVEYWVWDGANGWYYYTYQIHNTDSNTPFLPYIKHLTIANPTGEQYIVTGKSGGYLFDYTTNQPSTQPGAAWSAGSYLSLPTLVDWVAPSISFVFPGQSSWESTKFQFVSKLPPSMSGLTVRQGDLATYASGLIASPGASSMCPRSTGYWKMQYGTKGKRIEAPSLPNYQEIIGANSRVFSGVTMYDLSVGANLLIPEDHSIMLEKAKKELFGLWLNVVSGKINYAGDVSFVNPNNEKVTMKVQQIITDAENTILNASATQDQLEYTKDMAEILNNLL